MFHRGRISRSVGLRQSPGGALGVLLTLLPYFLLPFLFYGHLTKVPPASSGDPKAGPPIILSHPEKPPAPYHDNSCPICRGAESSQDCRFLPVLPGSDPPSPVRQSSLSGPFSPITPIPQMSSGPRAPPVTRPISGS